MNGIVHSEGELNSVTAGLSWSFLGLQKVEVLDSVHLAGSKRVGARGRIRDRDDHELVQVRLAVSDPVLRVATENALARRA